MKRIIPLILAILLLAGCGAAPTATQATYRQFSAAEAMDMMSAQEDYIILDVRTQQEYAAGHIPGAICVPNEAIDREKPAELPDADQLILVYCRSGNRSKQASQKLADLGYTNIVEFGGIIDWPGEITGDIP